MHGQLHTSWPVMQIAALRAESASQAQAPATAPRLAAAFWLTAHQPQCFCSLYYIYKQ